MISDVIGLVLGWYGHYIVLLCFVSSRTGQRHLMRCALRYFNFVTQNRIFPLQFRLHYYSNLVLYALYDLKNRLVFTVMPLHQLESQVRDITELYNDAQNTVSRLTSDIKYFKRREPLLHLLWSEVTRLRYQISEAQMQGFMYGGTRSHYGLGCDLIFLLLCL